MAPPSMNRTRKLISNRMDKITMKVVFVGDQAVGKTSLRNRYLNRTYDNKYKITIGAEFSVKRFLKESLTVCMQIWDLAGQAQFKPVRALYYSGTVGAVIVYDVTRRDSFENIPQWVEEILRHNQGKPVPLLIVANKIDLRDANPHLDHCVTKEEGEQMARRLEHYFREQGTPVVVQFCEVSAKLGAGVDDAIERFLKSLVIEA